MECFVVEKTRELKGHVIVGGCKNTSLKALLTFPHIAKGCLSLSNPATNTQTKYAMEVLTACGAEKEEKLGSIYLKADQLSTSSVFDEAIPQMRHFSRMAVPMVTHGEKFKMPLPGYSPYGPRPFEPVGDALKPFGISTEIKGNYVTLRWPPDVRFGGDDKIVAPRLCCRLMCEALLAAAVGRRGKTTIVNMAQDPDISDLIDLYGKFAPVKIEGKGTSKLVVRSDGIDVPKEYSAEFTVPGDYLEAATIAAAVLAIGGDVVIDGLETERILPLVPVIEGFGGEVELGKSTMHITASGRPKPYDFTTGIYPGFPTDAQGPFLTVAVLSTGSCIIKETIWTNRLTQSAELNRLGARVNLINNQTAITEPTAGLVGTSVIGTCPRAVAGLLIAGLCAEGETVVNGVDFLRNAYGQLENNLRELGARFRVVDICGVKESRVNKSLGRLEAF